MPISSKEKMRLYCLRLKEDLGKSNAIKERDRIRKSRKRQGMTLEEKEIENIRNLEKVHKHCGKGVVKIKLNLHSNRHRL